MLGDLRIGALDHFGRMGGDQHAASLAQAGQGIQHALLGLAVQAQRLGSGQGLGDGRRGVRAQLGSQAGMA